MGQNTSMYNKQGGFNIYPYPYTLKGKVMQFPYKFMLSYCNTGVFVMMFWGFSAPLFLFLTKNLGSPQIAKSIRERHQHQYDHPHFHWTIRPLRPDYAEYELNKYKGLKRWRAE